MVTPATACALASTAGRLAMIGLWQFWDLRGLYTEGIELSGEYDPATNCLPNIKVYFVGRQGVRRQQSSRTGPVLLKKGKLIASDII